jgi:hypothetical protein
VTEYCLSLSISMESTLPVSSTPGSPLTVMNAQAARWGWKVPTRQQPTTTRWQPYSPVPTGWLPRVEHFDNIWCRRQRVNLCKSTGQEVNVSMDGSNGEKFSSDRVQSTWATCPRLAAPERTRRGITARRSLRYEHVLRRRPNMLCCCGEQSLVLRNE